MDPKEGAHHVKQQLMSRFDCSDEGELQEYVGCKIVRNLCEKWVKFNQPILLQSYTDEFNLSEVKEPKTLMRSSKILINAKYEDGMDRKYQMYLRSGVEELPHMMR